jgi:hypothetical protein
VIASLRAIGRALDPEHPDRGRRIAAELVHAGAVPVTRRGRTILVALEDVMAAWRARARPLRPAAADEAFVQEILEREDRMAT